MWPHVYADVTEDMECFHEEFRAGRTVVKARDFDHALHLANASPYGLSSACYTNDRLEAYRFKPGIKAGMTGIKTPPPGLRLTCHSAASRAAATAPVSLGFGSSRRTRTGMPSTTSYPANCNWPRWMSMRSTSRKPTLIMLVWPRAWARRTSGRAAQAATRPACGRS
ncbi:MAG: hypothetical protein Ct9H300mP30_3780 [Methanobacteriota archaeon]|nr:MAG: hypothetical protein Ct9H300mP30_3780 [Euryarchaeota archaeon]